jgi:hypothetical protein
MTQQQHQRKSALISLMTVAHNDDVSMITNIINVPIQIAQVTQVGTLQGATNVSTTGYNASAMALTAPFAR